MSDFQTVFKTSPTFKLLQIMEVSEDYSADAVDAAKQELAGRSDVKEALEILNEKKAEAVVRKVQATKVESVIVKRLGALVSIINPFHSGNVTGERRLKLLLIFFGCVSIYQLVREIPFVYYGIMYEPEDLDFILSYHLLPILILPLGTFFLVRKHKLGWGILYAWSIGNCLSAIVGAYTMWDYEPIGVPAMDGLIPQTSSLQIILGGIVVAVILLAFLNKQVRSLVNVDRQTVVLWTIIGLVIPFWTLFF